MQAAEVDPDGKRTVGVVTKIDLVPSSDTTVADRLKGQGKNAWKYKLGTVAMRNRMEEEKDLAPEQVTEKEQAVFSAHPSLAQLSKHERDDMLGAGALVRKLLAIQSEAVRAAVPKLYKDMEALLQSKESALRKIPPACESPNQSLREYMSKLQSLSNTLIELHRAEHSTVNGLAEGVTSSEANTKGADSASVRTDQLSAAKALHMHPRLQELFHKYGKRIRTNSQDIFSPAFRDRGKEEMAEASGHTLAEQPNASVFRFFVEQQAQALRTPALELAHSVHEYMAELVLTLTHNVFGAFPSLQQQQQEAAMTLLGRSLQRVLAHIEEQVQLESTEFTLNHYYSDTKKKIMQRMAVEEKLAAEDNAYVRTLWTDKNADVLLLSGMPAPDDPTRYTDEDFATVTPADKAAADAQCPIPVSNFDRAVLETQVRLFCYRKVVHKRFVDQVCACLRLWFPTHVTKSLPEYMQQSVLAAEDSSTSGLQTLHQSMQEPQWRAEERKRLQGSLKRAREGLQELDRLTKRPATGQALAK